METTIAAISTAMSESGIGIVRISGEEAISIADKIYRGKTETKKISKVASHTINYGFIYDDEELVDEVLVMVMKAPHTYTGEDTVEIDCHGGVYSMKRVLETALKNGAVIAEPGEFTKRAFLNGRIDLSQAEAVMDVIQSKNEYALKASMQQLKGSVHEKISGIREKILYEIAYIESALDDPEHISLDGYPERLYEIVQKNRKELEKLLEGVSDGKIIKEGIKTVILGKPNAGKSSILNLLVGDERAIVTDIAGTTRDTLEEYINLNGITLRMIDTAGIRETDDIVEKIGIERARQTAEEADLILYVVDSSTDLDDNDDEIIQILKDRNALILYNKTDLVSRVTLDEIKSRIDKAIIQVSTKNKTGVEEIEDTIKAMFFDGKLNFNDEIYISNERQKEALIKAVSALKLVLQSIEDGMPEDFYSIDLMEAYESLGKITGETVEDDLVDEIFSKFCMGK